MATKNEKPAAFLVGFLLNALEGISELLSNGETTKATGKVYEALKLVKDNIPYAIFETATPLDGDDDGC